MKHLIAFMIISTILFSCGNKVENREMNEYVSAFLNENPSIALFGKADINTILDELEYKSVPKFGSVIQSVKGELSKMIHDKSAVYYAVEGPFDEKGPAAFYAFIDVKNAKGLQEKLTRDGYDFEQEGEISYTEFSNFCLGIRNDLAVLIFKKQEYDKAVSIAEAFDKCTGDLSEGKVNDILAQSGDVVLGVSLASIYATSNTELKKLSTDTQNEVKDLVTDSYSQTIVKFENGAAIIETKNYFSDALKAKMFFKKDNTASILAKMGHGEPKFGFSMNLDMKQIQTLVDTYAPNGLNNLAQELGGPGQMIMLAGGSKPLSGLLSGELAVLGMGEMGEGGSMIPQFNVYLGLGKKGQPLAGFVKSFPMTGDMKFEIDSKGIGCFSSPLYAPVMGQTIKLPEGCENFGKKGITGFVNFEGMDVSSFDLDGPAKLLKIVKYVTFEADENGSRIYIKAKKGNENILKQSMEFFIKEIEGLNHTDFTL